VRSLGKGRESGAVLVEFALVASLLIFLLLGLLEAGLLMNSRLVLVQAAREGARLAAVAGGLTTKVERSIREQLELSLLPVEDVAIEIKPKRAAYGRPIRVSLSYDYHFSTPLFKAALGYRLPVTVTFVTRSEKVRR